MDLSSELVPSPATKAYTDFLNAVAENEVCRETFAVSMACWYSLRVLLSGPLYGTTSPR